MIETGIQVTCREIGETQQRPGARRSQWFSPLFECCHGCFQQCDRFVETVRHQPEVAAVMPRPPLRPGAARLGSKSFQNGDGLFEACHIVLGVLMGAGEGRFDEWVRWLEDRRSFEHHPGWSSRAMHLLPVDRYRPDSTARSRWAVPTREVRHPHPSGEA